jgi:hypothetical protein
MRVLAIPTGGSAPAQPRFALSGGYRTQLSASAHRVAVSPQGEEFRAFAGPLAGPWLELAPLSPGYFQGDGQVDGDNVFMTEVSDDLEVVRAVVREAGGPPREVVRGFTAIAFSGDAMAYVSSAHESRVVVGNWRTGATRTVDLHEDVFSVDVREDGTAVAGLHMTGGIVLVSPTGQTTRIGMRGDLPRFAGDRVVYRANDGLRIVDPGGRSRRFGVPTASLVTFDADERHVLWTANGCLLVADVTAPAATAPDPGSCVRSEVEVATLGSKLGRDRRVHARFRCVAAPERCKGTLHLNMPTGHWRSRAMRFDVPVGDSVALTARVTRKAYRAARRAHERYLVRGVARVFVVGETLDPDGRRGRFNSAFLAATK